MEVTADEQVMVDDGVASCIAINLYWQNLSPRFLAHFCLLPIVLLRLEYLYHSTHDGGLDFINAVDQLFYETCGDAVKPGKQDKPSSSPRMSAAIRREDWDRWDRAASMRGPAHSEPANRQPRHRFLELLAI